MKRYWGDLHNHCGISYGHGSLAAALQRAAGQLDFASVTGHAFWPDMPADRERYGYLIDFHVGGFEKLAAGWDEALATFRRHHRNHEFVTFAGYEVHGAAYGDRTVILKEPEGPLVSGDTPRELAAALAGREHLLWPHHLGYAPGYRGIDWSTYEGPELSPLVEIHSMHGCSESDDGPYPYLHVMGPRDGRCTAQAGLAAGHRFGFAGSTDHHSAYPGSWGDGRLCVWARELTRDALFEAFRARRSYAVTGDKIGLDFTVAGAMPGEEVAHRGPREIRWQVEARAPIATVELLRNNSVVQTWPGVDVAPVDGRTRLKVRLEWGWGFKDQSVDWQGCVRLSDGDLLEVETCFSGAPVLAPTAGHIDEILLPHAIEAVDQRSCIWRSLTMGNPTTRHAGTQALILTLDARPEDVLTVELNGLPISYPLAELLAGSRCHYLRGLESEAVRLHRALPEAVWRLADSYLDPVNESEADWYYLRVRQRNEQYAWASPIWVVHG